MPKILAPMTAVEYQKKYGVQPFHSSTLPPEEKRNIAQKIGGFLGIEKFGQGIGQAIHRLSPAGKEEQKGLMGQVQRGEITAKDYEDQIKGGLSNREIAGSALNTAALLIPGAPKGASLAGKVAAGAGTGYALDVGSKLQNKENSNREAFTPGTGTVVGATLPILGAIFGKLNPKKLEEINLRMTPTEKQMMVKQGKDIPDFLAKRKIVGTPQVRYEKVNALYDAMEKRVSSVIEKSGSKFPKNEILKAVREIPEEFSDDITGYNEAQNIVKKIEAFIQNKSPMEISGTKLNDYKRNLFKRAYSKNNTDVVNESLHAVASKFNEILRASVPGLEVINKEYGNVLLSRKILFKAMSRPQTGLTGKILGTVAGAGVGGSIGGPLGVGVGGVIGEKVAENVLGTATRSTAGAVIQSVIDKIPSDKMGNLQITKKTLIRLLQGVFGQ